MKKIILIGTALLIVAIGCSQKAAFPVLSNKIYDKNGGNNDKSTFKLSSYERDARMKIFLTNNTSFLNSKIDTLYLLEGYNNETATFYGTIWNKSEAVNYSYFRGGLIVQKQSIFTNYQIKLITRWDTIAIRREERFNGNWLDNNLQINGIRCYKKRANWQIDEIYFKNFFDSQRDK